MRKNKILILLWMSVLLLVLTLNADARQLMFNDTCVSTQNYSTYSGSASTIGGGVCSHPATSGNAFTVTTGNVSENPFNFSITFGNLTVSPWQNGGNAIFSSIKNNSRTNFGWAITAGTTTGLGQFNNGVGGVCSNYGDLPSNSLAVIKLNVTDGFYYYYQDGVLMCKLVVGRNTTFIVFHTDNPVVKYSWIAMENDSAPSSTPPVAPANITLTLNMKNEYDNSTLYNFSVGVSNSSYFTNASTTTGSLAFELPKSGQYRVNISIANFYESLINFSVETGTANYGLTNYSIQALFNVTAKETISNTNLDNFNASLPFSLNTTTGSSLLLITNNTQQTVTGTKSGYFSTTTTGTATPGAITNLNVTFHNTALTINSTDALSGNGVNNITVTVSSLNHSYTYTLTNETGSKVAFNLLNNTYYNVTFSAYLYQNKSQAINITHQLYYNLTFFVFAETSFYLIFKDEQTKAVIDNASAAFISDVFSVNQTTTNGSIYVTLLFPAEYNIRYSAISLGYPQRSYFVTMRNKEAYNLTFYLLKNTTGSTVTATVLDQINNVVTDVRIKTLRYDVTTNTYSIVEMSETNQEGKANLQLQLSTEYYKFILEREGIVVLETTPSYVDSTSINFQIILEETFGQPVYDLFLVTTNLTYTNTTRKFRYYFNDIGNTISQGCLEVEKLFKNKTTDYNSSCVSATTGIIFIEVEEVNQTTYFAYGSVKIGQKTYITDILSITFGQVVEGRPGWVYLVLIEMTILGLAAFSPMVSLIILPVPPLLFHVTGILDIGYLNISILFAIAWAFAWLIAEKS